jgi:AraC-like DNA-binding protein
MTVRAKRSTSDAISHSSVPAALPAGHLEAAAAFGLDAAALRRAAGLRAEDLRNPDARIPLARHLALWEAIAATPGTEDFGFWLGRAVDVRSLGVVGYAMQHAADVRGAFRCLSRFQRLVNDVVSPIIEEVGDQVVFRRTEPPRVARIVPLSAATPVGTITLLAQLCGLPPERVTPVEVAFQHARPANAARYAEVLRCPVSFGAPGLRIVFPRALFDRPLQHADPGLFGYLERHAQQLESQLADTRTLAARVSHAVLETLDAGEPDQSAIAHRLALSERTLQRRLREEGTSFAALVDGLRHELARSYLDDPTLAVFEVAFLVGYSEPSAFNRAFRRWTRQTPGRYRAGRRRSR